MHCKNVYYDWIRTLPAARAFQELIRSCRAAHVRRGRAQAFYDRGGSCWSAQVLPSGSLKVTNEPHG
jgi:hypothetical protein